MTQAIQYRDPKDSEKAISSFAYRVLRRLHQLGARSHTLDDVKQELWIAWCKACESYRPDCGAQFSSFLYRGMQLHINRYIEKNFERFHDQTIAVSLDLEPSSIEDASLGDVIADDKAKTGEEFENEDCFNYALSRLSPRAAQFLTLLKEQPIDLVDEVKCLEAKADYARERGIAISTSHRITTPMIFDFMDASRTERKQIMDEVIQISKIIQLQVSA